MVVFNVSSFANVAYIPGDQTAYTATSTCGERFSITYPTGSPADYPEIYGHGASSQTPWKYLLIIQQSGGSPGTSSSAPSSSFDSVNGFPDDVLIRGLAVVEGQLTSFASGNTQVNGLGAMHHPGGIEGYYESRNRPNPLKDIVFLIQHLRFNTASYATSDSRSYKLSDWFALYGANSAFLVPWCGSAPSRACELGTGGAYEMNTVPNFIVANAVFPFNFLKFRQDEANQGSWFPAAETGGAGFDDTSAASLAAAPRRYVLGLGSYGLLSDIGRDLGAPCHPKTIAFTNTGPEDLNFGEPHIENVRKFNTGVHDGWHVLNLRQSQPPGTIDVRLSPAAANTLSDSQMTNTPIPRAFYDGNLNCAATGHVGSTGRVTFTGVPSDGDLLTISDGTTTVIFEWDSNASVTAGHTAITIGAAATPTDAGNLLVTAITNAGLLIAPTNAAGVVACPSTQTDIAANSTWTCTGTVTTTRGPASFGIVTFSNTGPADGDTITLHDGVRQFTFEADSGGGVTAGNVPFTATGNATTAMTSFKNAVIASGIGLSFNNSATAAAAVTMTINSLGKVDSTTTWSKSAGAANVTLNQPTGGGTASAQSITAEDQFTGACITALVNAAGANGGVGIPRWDATLPPAGICRRGQVAGGRVPATGTISFSANVSDADTVTLTDISGGTAVVFEFDSGGAITAGRIGVQIGASAAATMTNLLGAIAQTSLRLSWVAGSGTTTSTDFTSTLMDGNPNTTWAKSGANITISGLSGGKQGRPRVIVPPANGNGRKGVWLTCKSLSSDSDLFWGLTAEDCCTRLKPGERTWISGTGKVWARAAGGGSQVAKYSARECDERSR